MSRKAALSSSRGLGGGTPPSFWMEQRVWPLMHFLTPAALYWATRNAVVSILLIYVWESIEAAVYVLAGWRYVTVTKAGQPERELALDSLIGDPIMGALGIAVLAFADFTFHWPGLDDTSNTWPWWLRIAAFLTQSLPTLYFNLRHSNDPATLRVGALSYGGVYILGGALWYGIPLIGGDETARPTAALIAWLILAFVQTAQVALWPTSVISAEQDLWTGHSTPPGPLSAVWARTFAVGLIVGMAVLIAYATTAQ